MSDLPMMKAAIDIDVAKAFRDRSSLELDGMVQFLRQQIVDAEWEITRAQQSIEAYRAVIAAIAKAGEKE